MDCLTPDINTAPPEPSMAILLMNFKSLNILAY